MPFQSNPNKHPNYDPVAVNKIVNRALSKQRRLLKLIRQYRKESLPTGAAIVYKQIKELLVTLS
jgi:hypothetical protein